MIDTNQEEINTKIHIPKTDRNCLKTKGPYTYTLLIPAPSKGPSNEDKKNIAVKITGKITVEIMPLSLNFGYINLSNMYGKK